LQGIFVQPAATDTGQCLGNAIYGQKMLNDSLLGINFDSAYLGREYTIQKQSLKDILFELNEEFYIEKLDIKSIALLISKGMIVGWYQGRSEFGPRALGNRSILADPRINQLKNIINVNIKKREDFMPLAASILSEYCEEYFDDLVCDYMTLAPIVKINKVNKIPAVVHIDGTCRAQRVTKESNPKFHELISAFHSISDIPLLLNTSLNGAGDPICETPKDAILFFTKHPINYQVINDFVLVKKNIIY
jgi:carbamoyltransferase